MYYLRASSILAVASVALAGPALGPAPLAGAAVASPTGIAGSGRQGEVTLWRGESVACPAAASTSPRSGAVVGGDHEECFLLAHRVMTVDRVGDVHATPEPGGLHWEVDLTFDARQQRRFARITAAAIGHELAILDNGHLMSAPLVMDPITSGALSIDGLTEPEAQLLAHDLTYSE